MTEIEAAKYYITTMRELVDEIEKASAQNDTAALRDYLGFLGYGVERATAIINGEKSDEDASAWGDDSWMDDLSDLIERNEATTH